MDYISGKCKSKRTLNGKTVIITGCNTGVGKETALDMYKRGARVIMACRDIIRAETAKQDIMNKSQLENNQGSLTIEKLDLSSLASVRECAHRILANEKQIDILINNAGVFMAPKDTTQDGFELHIGTNHFGHALFTLLLMPKILKNTSRIVIVSSMLHAYGEIDLEDLNIEKSEYGPLNAYCRSKAANVLFARALHLKLREYNINHVNVYSLHPGVVATEIGRHLHNSLLWGATWLFNYVLSWFMKSVHSGAQTTIYCAVDEECDNQSGLYYSDCAVAPTSNQCSNDEEALKLWDLTIEKLNLQGYNPFDQENVDVRFSLNGEEQ